MSSSSPVRWRRSARPTPRARSASSTLAPAVSQGNSAGSWNIIATRPETAMLPAVGLSSPATSDSIVDLPQPDAPIRQVNSPGATERDTWSRAWTAAGPRPYTLETPASVTADASVTVLVVISVALISVRSTRGVRSPRSAGRRRTAAS